MNRKFPILPPLESMWVAIWLKPRYAHNWLSDRFDLRQEKTVDRFC